MFLGLGLSVFTNILTTLLSSVLGLTGLLGLLGL
jgi:hypothetical protein